MKTIIALIDQTNEIVGKTVSWLVLGMVLTMFCVVILRYFFNTGWIAMQESISYMHGMVFLLAIAYTLKHDAHVRVDIFYRNFQQRTQSWINLFGTLFLLFPMGVFIIWVSWDYVVNSWEIKEASREAGGLAGVYLLKSVIIIAAILFLLQGLSQCLKSLLTLQNKSS
ncbi:MAG: TRAP transporter small permease subunit [Methylococcales bacterium]|nr:TRAP transporter small permease subunit [Methylococcales bacterium]MBT7408666.1 TRAP transporter small permease subunit [Methylococcales bacterium]